MTTKTNVTKIKASQAGAGRRGGGAGAFAPGGEQVDPSQMAPPDEDGEETVPEALMDDDSRAANQASEEYHRLKYEEGADMHKHKELAARVPVHARFNDACNRYLASGKLRVTVRQVRPGEHLYGTTNLKMILHGAERDKTPHEVFQEWIQVNFWKGTAQSLEWDLSLGGQSQLLRGAFTWQHDPVAEASYLARERARIATIQAGQDPQRPLPLPPPASPPMQQPNGTGDASLFNQFLIDRLNRLEAAQQAQVPGHVPAPAAPPAPPALGATGSEIQTYMMRRLEYLEGEQARQAALARQPPPAPAPAPAPPPPPAPPVKANGYWRVDASGQDEWMELPYGVPPPPPRAPAPPVGAPSPTALAVVPPRTLTMESVVDDFKKTKATLESGAQAIGMVDPKVIDLAHATTAQAAKEAAENPHLAMYGDLAVPRNPVTGEEEGMLSLKGLAANKDMIAGMLDGLVTRLEKPFMEAIALRQKGLDLQERQLANEQQTVADRNRLADSQERLTRAKGEEIRMMREQAAVEIELAKAAMARAEAARQLADIDRAERARAVLEGRGPEPFHAPPPSHETPAQARPAPPARRPQPPAPLRETPPPPDEALFADEPGR